MVGFEPVAVSAFGMAIILIKPCCQMCTTETMPYYIKSTKAKKKDKPLPLFDKAGVTVKKKPDLKAKLDKEFSLFIRLRDAMPNGYFRCISCGQIKPFEQADCGHYFSRTHLATRFDENNCHAECRHCNRFKADHLEGYRENLIAKIGQQKFDLLKWKIKDSKDNPQNYKKSDFDYEQLIKYYKALNKKLRKEKGL